MAPTTLVELREERVAKCPNSLAVIAGTRRATYAEVDRSASDLAVELRSRGVGPETLGGVCLDRSAELVVALSGVLKAGGAYVPLDPGYPADRLRYLVSDSGVRLVVTDAAHSDSPLFGAGVEAVPVGSGQAPASDPSHARPKPRQRPRAEPGPGNRNRTTWRTSSTPPGRLASRRAWRSLTPTSRRFWSGTSGSATWADGTGLWSASRP